MATDISCANRGISGSEAVQGRSLPGSAEERNRRVSTLLLVAHTLHAREIAHKVAGQGAAGFEPATRRLEDVSTESVPVHPCRPRGLDQGFHRTRNRQVWGNCTQNCTQSLGSTWARPWRLRECLGRPYVRRRAQGRPSPAAQRSPSGVLTAARGPLSDQVKSLAASSCAPLSRCPRR